MSLLDQLFQYSLRIDESSFLLLSLTDIYNQDENSSLETGFFGPSSKLTLINQQNVENSKIDQPFSLSTPKLLFDSNEGLLHYKQKYLKITNLVSILNSKIIKLQYAFLVKMQQFYSKTAQIRNITTFAKEQLLQNQSQPFFADSNLYSLPIILQNLFTQKVLQYKLQTFGALEKYQRQKLRIELFLDVLASIGGKIRRDNLFLALEKLKKYNKININLLRPIKLLMIKKPQKINLDSFFFLSSFNNFQISRKLNFINQQPRETEIFDFPDNLSLFFPQQLMKDRLALKVSDQQKRISLSKSRADTFNFQFSGINPLAEDMTVLNSKLQHGININTQISGFSFDEQQQNNDQKQMAKDYEVLKGSKHEENFIKRNTEQQLQIYSYIGKDLIDQKIFQIEDLIFKRKNTYSNHRLSHPYLQIQNYTDIKKQIIKKKEITIEELRKDKKVIEKLIQSLSKHKNSPASKKIKLTTSHNSLKKKHSIPRLNDCSNLQKPPQLHRNKVNNQSVHFKQRPFETKNNYLITNEPPNYFESLDTLELLINYTREKTIMNRRKDKKEKIVQLEMEKTTGSSKKIKTKPENRISSKYITIKQKCFKSNPSKTQIENNKKGESNLCSSEKKNQIEKKVIRMSIPQVLKNKNSKKYLQIRSPRLSGICQNPKSVRYVQNMEFNEGLKKQRIISKSKLYFQ